MPWPEAIAGLMAEIDADGINRRQGGVPLVHQGRSRGPYPDARAFPLETVEPFISNGPQRPIWRWVGTFAGPVRTYFRSSPLPIELFSCVCRMQGSSCRTVNSGSAFKVANVR